MGGRPGRSCKDRRQIQINIFHSVNVFSAVFEKSCGNSRGCYCATDSGRRRTDLCVREDVGRFGITEGSNVFEPFCVFCNIGNDIQKIEDCGQPQPDTDAAFSEKCRNTETDSSYFCLKQKIGQVKQKKLVHLKFFAYGSSDNKCGQDADGIQDENLQQDAKQFFKYNAAAADRVREKVFRSMIFFFVSERGYTDIRSKKAPPIPRILPHSSP